MAATPPEEGWLGLAGTGRGIHRPPGRWIPHPVYFQMEGYEIKKALWIVKNHLGGQRGFLELSKLILNAYAFTLRYEKKKVIHFIEILFSQDMLRLLKYAIEDSTLRDCYLINSCSAESMEDSQHVWVIEQLLEVRQTLKIEKRSKNVFLG